MGNQGPQGASGATGPQGPAGVNDVTQYTQNNSQQIVAEDPPARVIITGAGGSLDAGDYLLMFEADMLNNSNNTVGDYGFTLAGVPVKNRRVFGHGTDGTVFLDKNYHKMVINETLTVPSTQNLAVDIVLGLGEIQVDRYSLIIIKTS